MVGGFDEEMPDGFNPDWERHQREQIEWMGVSPHKIVVRWINPDCITVDHTYQRELNMPRVRKYAKNYNPVMAGAILVSQRNDGSCVVIDGQHRLAAARESKQPTILCHVVRDLSIQDEADLFWHLGVARTALQSRERFSARLVAKDPAACAIARIVSEFGYGLNLATRGTRDPRLISAITVLDGIYTHAGLAGRNRTPEEVARDGARALRTVLHFIRHAWGGDRDAVGAQVIGGVSIFFGIYGDLVRMDDLVDKLRKEPPAIIFRRAQARRDTMSGRIEQWIARGIWEAYNSGKRGGRLPDLFGGVKTE